MIKSLVLCLIISVSSKRLPPEINKCRSSDPKISDCLQTSITDTLRTLKDGNKDLGIVPLEPLIIPKLEFGNVSSGAVAVRQVYKNLAFNGITNSTIFDVDVKLDGDNCRWKFKASTPRLIVEGDYTMEGKVWVLTINGHGKSKNTLYDCVGTYDIKCERHTNKKGKRHMRVVDVKLRGVPERVVFEFENLVDGNEQLSREVLKTLNDNSVSVYGDVGPAIDEAMGQLWKSLMNEFFNRVPEDELFLP